MAYVSPMQQDVAMIGDRLRRWRLVRELPAAIVAERAGISLTTLRTIERGDGETVRFGAIMSVARVLGIQSPVVDAFEPLNTEIGRIRADRMTRKRAPR